MSWDNHRWVRYRSSLSALADLLQQLGGAWTAAPADGDRTYEQLARRGDEGPSSYRFARAAQRDLSLDLTDRLVEAAEALTASAERLDEQAPRPLPGARIVPRD
jgi:hypothetical protein